MTISSVSKQWVLDTAISAKNGGHVWPDFASCEAALESTYGSSLLARQDNNLFGTKQHKHPIYGTHNLPTREFLAGQWIETTAAWIVFPSVSACFEDRMATLGRLRTGYPHYNEALAATTGEGFVRAVSLTWSTDPLRGQKVLNIYKEMFGN
jgi:flagellum-specific peptidoglycan hydrolase FlgJ